MHYLLVIPGLLPDRANREAFLQSLTSPCLELVLNRGELKRLAQGYEDRLGELFVLEKGKHWPFAPLRYKYDGGSPQDKYWLCADPVHLQVNRDQLVLINDYAFSITKDEADELIATLNHHFAQDEIFFHAPYPTRWYIQSEKLSNLYFCSLKKATGKSIDKRLPQGIYEREFRALLNEIQMILFEHPINVAREQAGQLPINSIWFWGGGTYTPLKLPVMDMVFTDDVLIKSLAQDVNLKTTSVPDNAEALITQQHRQGNATNCMIVINEIENLASYGDVIAWRDKLTVIEEQWIKPLLSAVKKGHRFTIMGFSNDDAFEVSLSKSDLWKFWKSKHSLVEILI